MTELQGHAFNGSLSLMLRRRWYTRVPWAAVCLISNFIAAALGIAVGLTVATGVLLLRNIWLAAWDALQDGFKRYPWRDVFVAYPNRAWRYAFQKRAFKSKAFKPKGI